MFGRRIAILVAVLMGLTALAASLAPPPQPGRRNATPTPVPTPPPVGSTANPAGVADLRLEVRRRGARLAHVRARVGDTVMLEVSGNVVDSVVVDHFDAIEPIDPGTPAALQLEAAVPGSFAVRLVDHRQVVGVLDVSG
jgi:hypothetical protein